MKIIPNSWKMVKSGVLGNECSDHMPNGDKQAMVNRVIIELARGLDLPLLMTLDAHFVEPEKKFVQDILLQNGRDDGWRFTETYYQMSTDEAWDKWVESGMAEDYKDEFVESVKNNHVFAKMAEGVTLERKIRLPRIDWIPHDVQSKHPAEEEGSYDKQLEEMALQIIIEKGRIPLNEEYMTRLGEELEVICNNPVVNFLPYFLFLERVCEEARQEGNGPGPGRGSAAGCLLSYALGITEVDPINYDLSFARFLSLGRIARGKFPDIDLDFANPADVAASLKAKYGEMCARICTTGTSKPRNAIRDVARVLLNTKDDKAMANRIDHVCKTLSMVPQGMSNSIKWLDGWEDDNGNHHPGELERNDTLREFFELHPEVEEGVRGVLDVPRSIGRHAAAYCVADDPISDVVPMCTVNGEECTQFTMGPVESLGLIKIDLLGLNTLGDIQEACRIIEESTGEVIDPYKDIPLDDKKTWEAFHDGDNATVFQFNSAIGVSLSKRVQPESILDLAQMTAAGRPGVMDAIMPGSNKTYLDAWVERRKITGRLDVIHESVREILEPTAGICLFQEQISAMFSIACGYSEEEADEIREIVGKKKKDKMEKLIPEIRKKLFDSGWTDVQADSFISMCEAAANYSFNKSHAVAYSLLGYICQYLKTNYSVYWWTAVLRNSSIKDLEKFRFLCDEKVLFPDINSSDAQFFVAVANEENKGEIRYPLRMVKKVANAAQEIVRIREALPGKVFSSLSHFVEVASGRAVNKGVITALIYAGAFDRVAGVKTPGDRVALLRTLREIRKDKEEIDVPEQESQRNLWMLIRQYEALPFYVPKFSRWIDGLIPGFSSATASGSVRRLANTFSKRESKTRTQPCSIVGMISEIRMIKTKKGDDMAFLNLVDDGESVSVTVFPQMFEDNKRIIEEGNIVAVVGCGDYYSKDGSEESGRWSLIADTITCIYQEQ